MKITLQVQLDIEDDEEKATRKELVADAVQSVDDALSHFQAEGFSHPVVPTASISNITVRPSKLSPVESES